MNKKTYYLFLFIAIFMGYAQFASASIGVSPPYIKSEILRPGTEFVQDITILRSAADEDVKLHVALDAPDIASWITVDGGFDFTFPKGQLRLTKNVIVKVPDNAPLGHYSGQMSISTKPADNQNADIAIALGAILDLNFTITDKVYTGFKIRGIRVPDFESPGKLWSTKILSWLKRPLKVLVRVENTGNIEVPSPQVTLDVYQIPAREKIASFKGKSKEKIPPYQLKEVAFSFPSTIAAGEYWGKVKIYQEENIIFSDQDAFVISSASGLFEKFNIHLWQILCIVLLLVGVMLLIIWRNRKWRNFFKKSKAWIIIERMLKKIRLIINKIWYETKFYFWNRMRHKSLRILKGELKTKKKSMKITLKVKKKTKKLEEHE